MEVKQWDIFMCDLGTEGVGSEQRFKRPVLVIQNDIGNKYSPTVIVAIMTGKIKKEIPTHMHIDLFTDTTIMFEQIRTIDKSRLLYKIGRLKEQRIEEAKQKLLLSLGL